MTTKQIIQEMEKELVKKARRTDDLMDYEDYYEIPVDKFHSYTRKLIEAVAEEIIGEDGMTMSDRLGDQLAVLSKNALRTEQRLKVKEILEVIK